MAEAAKKTKPDLGTYKGYPITEIRIEWRGLEGGLTDAVAIGSQLVTEPEDFVFIGSKGRKDKEGYIFVRNDEDEITGVIVVQTFKALGADFVDEKKIGAALHSTMEKVANARALAKSGQQNLGLSIPDPEGALEDRAADTRSNVREIRSGVPDDEGKSETEGTPQA